MSGLLDSNQQTKQNQAFKNFQKHAPTTGIYLGRVVATEDELKSGLCTVSISAMGKDGDEKSTVFFCTWSSPFAGTTDVGGVGPEIENFDQTQKSYGMWMVPPDVGNLVLVAFADGKRKMPIIIGCLYDNQYHYMVPGMASGKSYSDPAMLAPVAEKNRKDGLLTHDDANRPIHIDMAETLNRQGLINDEIRGAGKSSSRRESPSEVFGILTPGPKAPDFQRTKNRLAGHQFIMDDNKKSRMIRLRTAGGSQLLLDDTTGSVYAINKLGTSWMEMTALGDFHVYAGSSINMRTRGNFNLRADKNVNIEAGQNVNIKAAGDNVAGKYVGLPDLGSINIPSLGTGGDINFDAASSLNSLARANQTHTAGGGSFTITSAGATRVNAGFDQIDPNMGFFVNTTGGVQLSALQQIDISSPIATNLLSAALVNIFGGLTNINSATGAALISTAETLAAARSKLITPATALGVNDFEDNKTDAPEFDKEAARKGETGFPTGGLREKQGLPVQSIVSTMVTNEPFIGHAQYDPTDLEQTAPGDIGFTPPDLPPNGTDLSGAPADVSTPDGFLAGTSYQGLKEEVVSAGGALGAAVQDALPGLGALGGQYGELAAQYTQIAGVFNNFQALQNVNLFSIQGLTQVISALQTILPFLPFPTTGPLQQQIIGYTKLLNEQMAQLEQFALDQFGQVKDLLDEAIGDMQGAINNALNQALDGADLDALLAESGITNIGKDLVPPEDIFQDALGNILVDFSSKGLGAVGASLGLTSDINSAFNNVKGYFNENVQLSENQSLAISNFVHNIGEENFLNSNVFEAIQDGKLDRVPHLMQGWVLGSPQPGEATQPLAYLQDRREWEAEIFQTPDGVEPPDFSGFAVGELTLKVAAQKYRQARYKYIQELAGAVENQGFTLGGDSVV